MSETRTHGESITHGDAPAEAPRLQEDWHGAFPDLLLHEDRYYILATSSLADERTRVLKHGETFAVFDHYGDIKPLGLGEEGVYHAGTRFLSAFSLRLAGTRPLFLSSTVEDEVPRLAVDLTNPDLVADDDDGDSVTRGSVHLQRRVLLWDGCFLERLTLRNFADEPVRLGFSYHFAADFADLFEVRGVARERRGTLEEPEVAAARVRLPYRGLDGARRVSELTFDPPPTALSAGRAVYQLEIAPGSEVTVEVSLACDGPETAPTRRTCGVAADLLAEEAAERRRAMAQLTTSNQQLDAWLARGASDLHLLITDTPEGPYPYAGVPWYSTPFGRDGLITALEWLVPYPDLAKGVLAFLAARQATETNAEQDAEPGKIVHEIRRGEMAALGEIPFARYYGSVDSTPLFVLLAGRAWERTGDRTFFERLWPHVEAALDWIDHEGDLDGDGFLEYRRRTERGLVQQGWKDSHDSVFHADGRSAEGPIALCEVQGYVYGAKLAAARLARDLGHGEERARRLEEQAAELRRRFEERFWCDDLGTYALALDGDKRPCRVVTSNAGHCLWSGIAAPERAARVRDTLRSPEMASGWGIRTLATGQPRYNPMSYHNGSVWPHDTALVARGLADYGFADDAGEVLSALFEASLVVDLHRLPELYCGFPRRRGTGPILYPVACSPQAWATGVGHLLIEACLGLTVDAPAGRVRLAHPYLPPFLERVSLSGLRVGEALLDLDFERHAHDVGVNVRRRQRDVEVVVIK